MHYKMLCFPKPCHTVNLGGYHLHSKSIDVIVEMELLNRFCMCDFANAFACVIFLSMFE